MRQDKLFFYFSLDRKAKRFFFSVQEDDQQNDDHNEKSNGSDSYDSVSLHDKIPFLMTAPVSPFFMLSFYHKIMTFWLGK